MKKDLGCFPRGLGENEEDCQWVEGFFLDDKKCSQIGCGYGYKTQQIH